VTLSGGEAMAQDTAFLANLTARLYEEGVNVTIDTSGYAPWSQFEAVIPYTKLFLYDIKLMDRQRHLKYTGVDNWLILENLLKLRDRGSKFWLRLPLIHNVNDSDSDIEQITTFLKKNKLRPARVSLLPYHDAGRNKLKRLGRAEQPYFVPPPGERLTTIQNKFEAEGFSPIFIGA
jgi:pyruvate formate lyase activating enzyme